MTTIDLIRWSGFAAILAGFMPIVITVLQRLGRSLGSAEKVLYGLASTVALFAIMGLYAYQHEKSGLAGLIGFVLCIVANALMVGGAGGGELLGRNMYILGEILIMPGLLLLAIGFWTAGLMPAWIPGLWVAAIVIGLGFAIESVATATTFIASLLFGVGFIAAGLQLL